MRRHRQAKEGLEGKRRPSVWEACSRKSEIREEGHAEDDGEAVAFEVGADEAQGVGVVVIYAAGGEAEFFGDFLRGAA